MSEGQIQEAFEPLYFRPYQITVEDRNQRLVMRSIKAISENDETKMVKDNI